MGLKSSSDRYGTVAIIVHWTSALLIAGMLASGFKAAGSIDSASKLGVLRVHVVVGVLVLLLTVFRMAWWLLADRKPRSVSGERLPNIAAKAVHALFYVVIIGMAASGVGMLALSGAATSIFGSGSAALPDFWNYAPRVPHGIGARALIVLLVLHVGGALYHHVIRGDRIFARMGIGH